MGVVRSQNIGTQKYFLSDALEKRMRFPENIIFKYDSCRESNLLQNTKERYFNPFIFL